MHVLNDRISHNSIKNCDRYIPNVCIKMTGGMSLEHAIQNSILIFPT